MFRRIADTIAAILRADAHLHIAAKLSRHGKIGVDAERSVTIDKERLIRLLRMTESDRDGEH